MQRSLLPHDPRVMPSQLIEFRVQYIDDVDPFNVLASIKHAEPTVPKKYQFVKGLSLYDQLPGLKKLLRAPHKKVSLCLCNIRPLILLLV